jgi:choline dehydrogenase-like flavoprotein
MAADWMSRRGTPDLVIANAGVAGGFDTAEADDLARLVRGVRLTRHILAQPALARHGAQELASSAQARSDADIARFIRRHADTIYHPVGSCRMGPAAQDVVDSQLRVRGVQGLRVVDASIMPRIVSGNTNAPTVMIAERAVEWIRQSGKNGERPRRSVRN